ncbi:uncharacterized protein LOC125187275 [Salvia hispanica]|uniref:uncharacterized protein LOC125187275 n=1 Tax=Salvia hispanica TaxID=49212 RepID=UPI0020098BE3|nr:uncharacterized protein LOC125187275 [Salvia hispanica]
MVTDQEIAQAVETVLRQSDPNAVTSLNGVVQRLEAKLGLSLAHKAEFIRDQITFLLRSNPVPKDQLPPQPHYLIPQPFHQPPHFALHQQADPAYTQPPQPSRPPKEENAAADTPKGRAPSGTKRRGGPGGLNKLCGVSPKLQAIVGQPELPRTEIVKQLWVYIRKHNLQDPENKRKIICDDALRLVFETDCTDMFKMNKLLAKHILRLEPMKEPVQAKKSKVEDDSTKQKSDPSLLPVVISGELAKFFGTGEKVMLQSEALGRVWEYIKSNKLEDPLSSMVIHCDAKLQELLGCESISALGIQEMLLRHHLLKQC